jgi:hypothetical protein
MEMVPTVREICSLVPYYTFFLFFFHYKKHAKLWGFFSHFAGVFNLCKLFCGGFDNCCLKASHKLIAGVLGDRWYPVENQ